MRFLIVTAYSGILFLASYRLIAAETNTTSTRTTIPLAALPAAFVNFVTEKRALAEAIAKKHELKMPSEVLDFFFAAQNGDWVTTSNLFYKVQAGTYRRPAAESVPRELWGAIHDTFGFYELFEAWNPELLNRFGIEIVESIPPGSIYFGGTEFGRFAVSTFSQSHSAGRPFFTLTQNAFADSTYLGYLRDMYGERIYIPDTNDYQKCFLEYGDDAQKRLKHDQDFPNEPRQLRPGEDVRLAGGKIQLNGQVAVMAFNALLAKTIFDRNPGHEFYYEESFPLDWVYPHLTPHQFVFKLNREPLKEISLETVRADREFWIRNTDSWLGAWLKTNTALSEVTNFVDRTYLKNDLKEFTGDSRFIRDLEARKTLSHLRGAIASLYVWRATNTKNAAERERMAAESDFAFRQAFAMCPTNPGTVARYVELLVSGGRVSDAAQIAGTAYRMDPEHKQLGDYVEEIVRKAQRAEKEPTQK
jgi:hypothetical protein